MSLSIIGPPDSRPSKLVEKIIERIRIQERLKVAKTQNHYPVKPKIQFSPSFNQILFHNFTKTKFKFGKNVKQTCKQVLRLGYL